MINIFRDIKVSTKYLWIGFGALLVNFLFAQLALAAPLTYSSDTNITLTAGSVTVKASSVADTVVVNAATLVVTMSSTTGGTFVVTSLSNMTVTQTGSGTITQVCNAGPISQVTLTQSAGSSVYTFTPTGSGCTAANTSSGGGTPAPTFVNFNPPLTGTVGSSYAYTVQVTYTEATNTITYALTSAPVGMTIGTSTGIIQWTPTATGSFNVSLNTYDSYNNTITKSWLITVSSASSGGSSGGGGGGGGGSGYSAIPATPAIPASGTNGPATPAVPATPASGSAQDRLNALLATLQSLQAQQSGQQGSSVSAGQIQAIVIDLQMGSNSSAVKDLQLFLIAQAKGPAAKALAKHGTTTHFGGLTRAALKEFQKSVGITPASGYFGPKTKAFLKSKGY